MKYFGDGLSELHKQLSSIIRKKDCLEQSKQLFLDLHSKLNMSAVSNTDVNEVDALLGDLLPEEYAVMPTAKDETIAWVIWHIARIEDLTMNLLVANGEQVFNNDWKIRLNVNITDTANSLSDEQIMSLSKNINTTELINYRNAVAKRTRSIVEQLTFDDIKHKPTVESLNRILSEGGVTTDEDSIWLVDFWGKKDVAGLLLMPPTRHVMLHLNDCCKWKTQIRTRKKFFLS